MFFFYLNNLNNSILNSTDIDVTTQSELKCASDEFLCDNTCFNAARKCDGIFDCLNHSDESLCPTTEVEPSVTTPCKCFLSEYLFALL